MTRDLVITASSGYTFEQVRCWLNSLDRSGFDGERVVVVANGEPSLISELRRRQCTVVTRDELAGDILQPQDKPFADADICVERFILYWAFLKARTRANTRYVIAVDVRDVVFQLNPSDWLSRHMGDKKCVVSSEGITYGDQPWNRANMIETFGSHVFEYMKDRLVWNCGTIAGELGLFRDLSLVLHRCCAGMTYSDQASLNVLLALEPYRELTLFDDGSLGWACEAGTMSASARGPALSYRFQGREPLFDGDAVYTRAGRLFCIVHQYDRIASWKVALERRFAG